ncbi:MAG: diguanylate cyclase [Pseudomonadota bacterium]
MITLVVMTWSCPAAAATPLFLDPDIGGLNLTPYLEVLRDPENKLTIDDIAGAAQDAEFQPHPAGDQLELGLTQATVWLRFKLRPSPETPEAEWFIEFGLPGTAEIDFYTPSLDGGRLMKKSGSGRKGMVREIAHRSYVLSVPRFFDPTRYFYVRLKSMLVMSMPIRLWRPTELTWEIAFDYYGFGVIYGIMIAMIIYNFSIFLFLSDRTYLYYVAYICSMLTHLGVVYGHIPSQIDWFFEYRLMLIWPVMGVAWLMAGAFCRSFLNSAVVMPRLDLVLKIIMSLGAILFGLGLAGLDFAANIFGKYMTIIGCFTAIVAAITAWRRGFKPAKYFLFAWIILLTGLVLYVIGGIYIPSGFLTRYTAAIGASLESLILSAALAARIKQLRAEKDEFRSRADRFRWLSQTDGLTSLFNKAFMLERLAVEVDSANAHGRPLALIIMDVDDFKAFNDSHGHPAGDKVLQGLARILKFNARGGDFPCRYGGEEFALILPGVHRDNAMEVAERIRKAFGEIVLRPAPEVKAWVTMSLGVAELRAGEPAEMLLKRTDKAMYQAKQLGKNQSRAAK